MNLRILLPAAVLALGASPALAQHGSHDHGAMHGGHGTAHSDHGKSSTTIAEGNLVKGVRTFDVAVTEDGFVPNRVKVKKGEKVRLLVTRKTDSTCAKEIVIKDFAINTPLPLNETASVEFTPARSGEIRWACGMDHVSGVAFVP